MPAAKLTVVGGLQHVPADAASADPLSRTVPMQTRIGHGSVHRALVTALTPAQLTRRLYVECAMLAALFSMCTAAAALALLV
jgi:hypothetical protein